ncbi:MAG: hypothetical protein AAFQ80_01045 [Cyanobacteria bacterium J06621_8]
MSDNEFDIKLELLSPEDIPLESQLGGEVKEQLTGILISFLKALKKSSADQALSEITNLLEYLDTIKTTSVKINRTQASLKNCEIEDYDRFFKINRVQTSQPGIALVKGLLLNTQTFISLCQQCGARLDSQQVELQKQGLIAYARLLARNFNLDIPDK